MAQDGSGDEQAAQPDSWRAGFDAAAEPLAVIGVDGRIQALNRRLREQLGVEAEAEAESWIGRPAAALAELGRGREGVAERLRALDELASGLTHSFNNTLTAVLAHAQVLVRSPGLPSWAREDLAVIERVAREAAAKVRQVQGFARARSSAGDDFSDLGDAVATAIARTRPRWNPPNQPGRWRVEWSPSPIPLPIATRDQTGDQTGALIAVLAELIEAGLAALPEGGTLAVTTGADVDQVWVEVRWRGRMPLPSLGDPGRLAAFGGRMRLLGDEGEGGHGDHEGTATGVILALPSAGGRAGASRAPRHERRGRPPSATILLVEDDATVRRSITQMLTELGHRCVTAGDGREALRVLAERPRDAPIDVLITDLAMPNLDGRALLRDLGQRYPGLPRIVVTGLRTEGDADLRHGPEAADAVLTKPLELTALEAVLARVLEGARAR